MITSPGYHPGGRMTIFPGRGTRLGTFMDSQTPYENSLHPCHADRPSIRLATAADETVSRSATPRSTFQSLDRNADGGISLDEYKISTVGHIDPARVGDCSKRKNADGDGKLSMTEFTYVPRASPRSRRRRRTRRRKSNPAAFRG